LAIAFAVSFGILAWGSPARAALIDDIDLLSLTFERDNTAQFINDIHTVTGTSNGVGWTFVVTGLFNFNDSFSNTNNAQIFNDLPTTHDDIHVRNDFTITFDTPITSLLVGLANDTDGNTAGPDLGLAPVDGHDITLTGTRILVGDTSGSLALYLFNTPTTVISNTGFPFSDAFDFVFFTDPLPASVVAVPLPDALPLFGAGLGMLGFLGWWRRREAVVA